MCRARCAAFRIQDVDLQKGIVSIKRSSWEGGEQTPKRPNATRKVGIDVDVVRILGQQIGQRKIGYVFSARNGNPLREGSILKRRLHPVLKKAWHPAVWHACLQARTGIVSGGRQRPARDD
jgi:hypothetical protein